MKESYRVPVFFTVYAESKENAFDHLAEVFSETPVIQDAGVGVNGSQIEGWNIDEDGIELA